MALHHYTLAGALLFAASTASAAPCAGFLDVEDTSPFCANVQWLRNRGVTNGCEVDSYCPDQPVTRLQMAAFMNRLANSLFPLTCASGQVMKWNGASWACADDANTPSGGSVISVMAGTGLQGSPNPITGSGSINVAPTYQLPQSCGDGEVPKWSGSVWSCGADLAGGGGTVTSITAGAGLTGGTIIGSGTIAADTTVLQQRVTGSCAIGSSIRAVAADGTVTCHTDNPGPANAFVHGGNAFGATAVIGTTDNNSVSLVVNNTRALLVTPRPPAAPGLGPSVNVLFGSPANSIVNYVDGATIAGGGMSGTCVQSSTGTCENRVEGSYSVVSGGLGNHNFGSTSVIAGGSQNTVTNGHSTIAGGAANRASGAVSTVGGGNRNVASGDYSVVPGGLRNTAAGVYSVAMGYGARTESPSLIPHDGSFAFADYQYPHAYFHTTAQNEFAARATGGVRFVTAVDGAGVPTWTCGVSGGAGGSWGCSSDRNLKGGLKRLDGVDVLMKLVGMPVYSWFATADVRRTPHAGPTAQDFMATFGLGDNDRMIGFADAQGVAFSAIQGLHALLTQRDARIAALERELKELRELKTLINDLVERWVH